MLLMPPVFWKAGVPALGGRGMSDVILGRDRDSLPPEMYILMGEHHLSGTWQMPQQENIWDKEYK